jgi:Fe-S cluster biogenesis protein NfuA
MSPLESLLQRMEELLSALDELGDQDRASVFELLDGIDTLHRHALIELADGLGVETIERLRAGNDAIAWLFEAYGIGVDQQAAAERALEEIRPYIHSHGGRVKIVDVANGVVRLRMSGACAGCTASAVTLTEGIEQALREHLPGFSRIETIDEPAEPHAPPGPVMVQIERRPPETWQ